jgi:hypothetical protein
LWGHVKFGGDILRSGIESSDPYSFGSDRPWINHEWLAEVTMHVSWVAGGNVGLIATKTLFALMTVGLVLAVISRRPTSPGMQVLLIFAVLAGIRARIYVFRPQIFSLVLIAGLIGVEIRQHKGKRSAGQAPIPGFRPDLPWGEDDARVRHHVAQHRHQVLVLCEEVHREAEEHLGPASTTMARPVHRRGFDRHHPLQGMAGWGRLANRQEVGVVDQSSASFRRR